MICFVCHERNHLANSYPRKGKKSTTNKHFVKKSVDEVSDEVDGYIFTVGM